jgi:hypothetical protein
MMLRHEVPTHLDVEDKILFGLTVRQMLFLVVGVSAGYAIWNELKFLPHWLALVPALLMPLLAFVLAVFAPYGQPLESWVMAVMRHRFIPHVYVWFPVDRCLDRWEEE